MTKSRIIWFSLTALTLIVFFTLIPVDVYEKHDMLYSFLGAILFFIFLFMGLGDFKSLDEIIKQKSNETEDQLRKLSPYAVFPAFILVFLFVLSQSSRKSDELVKFGVLAKGVVIGGESTSSTRRGRTTTTYDITVKYMDSLKNSHTAELDVNGEEFNDLYEGATVDIVYSRKHPDLAKAVLNLQEMSKYKKIAMGDIKVENMLAILEGKVNPDSVRSYLNTVCYEWREHEDGDYYINDQKKIAIAVVLEQGKVLLIRETLALSPFDPEQKFEKSAEEIGFKKRESTIDGKTNTEYYNDQYVITRERRSIEGQDPNNFINNKALEVYSLIKM